MKTKTVQEGLVQRVKTVDDDQKSVSSIQSDDSTLCKREYLHTNPVHTAIRASPLSRESGEQNYRGFFNLAILLLGVSNVRLVIENYLKYGLIVSLPFTALNSTDLKFAFLGFVFIGMHILIAFEIERMGVKLMTPKLPTNSDIKIYHITNLLALLFISALNSWYFIWHPLVSCAPLFAALIVFLKLISYALVNGDLRNVHMSGIQVEKSKYLDDVNFDLNTLPFPKNITLGNLCYFIFAPTLSYQPVYPRNEKIRYIFIFKRCMEFMVGVFGMYFLAAQYAGPILKNSIKVIESRDYLHLFERILKLSVISVLMWLLMFWAFFHCFLNITAEILRFGDRRFYQPWWNARDISEYWRLWNNPVYTWGKRHIYLALNINYKTSRHISLLVVFFISAVLHEVMIGIPTHVLNGTAFWGMIGQIPLIIMTNYIVYMRDKKFPQQKELFDTIGNFIFWTSFTILGQPTCIMIYYTQWYYKNATMS